MTLQDEQERYKRAAEAMLEGVSRAMGLLINVETSPKVLRVTLNKVDVSFHAMLILLCKKNIITEEEYVTAMADSMEAEVHRYEAFLSEKLGVEIKLL